MLESSLKLACLAVACCALMAAPVTAEAKKAGASKADYRSAKSGKYVKKDYADKNKDTTVREERKKQ